MKRNKYYVEGPSRLYSSFGFEISKMFIKLPEIRVLLGLRPPSCLMPEKPVPVFEFGCWVRPAARRAFILWVVFIYCPMSVQLSIITKVNVQKRYYVIGPASVKIEIRFS